MQESDEDIEDWVEGEKKRLEKDYYQQIRKGKDLKKAKESFQKEMQELKAEYEKRYDKYLKEKRKEDMHKPISEYRKKYEALKKKYEQEYLDWKEAMEKHWESMLEEAEKKKVDFDLRWHEFLKHFHK